jgi:cytoskeletal protein RodZ
MGDVDGGVGNNLREARGRRKLSLEEVEATTKIRGRYLQAIEDEDWDQLPSDTYARAFIRTYAALVGLDGDRLAEEQRQTRGAARPGERLPRVDPKPRPVTRSRRRHRVPPRLVTAAVLALVVAALLAVGLSSGGGSDETTGKAGQRPSAPHIGQAVPVR